MVRGRETLAAGQRCAAGRVARWDEEPSPCLGVSVVKTGSWELPHSAGHWARFEHSLVVLVRWAPLFWTSSNVLHREMEIMMNSTWCVQPRRAASRDAAGGRNDEESEYRLVSGCRLRSFHACAAVGQPAAQLADFDVEHLTRQLEAAGARYLYHHAGAELGVLHRAERDVRPGDGLPGGESAARPGICRWRCTRPWMPRESG